MNNKTFDQVATQEKDIIMDLNSIKKDDIGAFEDFLTKYRKLLHQSHAAMMEVLIHCLLKLENIVCLR